MGDTLEDMGALRNSTVVVGVATTAFGLAAAVAPDGLTRRIDAPVLRQPATLVALRCLGICDAVTGAALTRAALSGGDIARWLLVRALVEGIAALSIGGMAARGGRSRSLTIVGLLALSLSAIEMMLWRSAKRASLSRGTPRPDS